MPIISELDVVNDMLATLGELPINALDEDHPYVPTALRILRTANARVQGSGWWFNKELTDLNPDEQGNIYLPNDTLRVDPQAANLKYVQRGRRLYKPFEPSSADKYHFDTVVRCWLIREVPFDDLPIGAQSLISFEAQLEFMKDYDADSNKINFVAQFRLQAKMDLNAEHTRSVDINMLRYRGGVMESRTSIGVERLTSDLY